MKRRDFAKKGSIGILITGSAPVFRATSTPKKEQGSRKNDKWLQMNTGKMGTPERHKTLVNEVAVIGG